MPKEIALIFCMAFIFWLLRIERKQNPSVTWALWIPTIWMLTVTAKPLASWFETGGTSMEEGSALDRIFLTALFVVAMITLWMRRFDWRRWVTQYGWLLLLIGFMLVSIAWSDMFYVSVKRWWRSGLTPLAMASIVLTEKDGRQAVKSILTRTIYVCIPLSMMLIKYYPHLGVSYGRWSGALMWIGVGTQKNGLARICLVSAFFLLWNLIKRWQDKEKAAIWYLPYIELFLLAVTSWLFMGPDHTLTYSATSIAALVIGLFLFFSLSWLSRRSMRVPRILKAGVVVIVFYGTLSPLSGSLIFNPATMLNRSADLTGRTEIWASLTPSIMSNPVLGHGFGGFWSDAVRIAADASHAHNGYLEVILQIGFLGLFVWTGYIIYLTTKACNEMKGNVDWGILWYCFLAMGLVHNIAESSMDSLSTMFQAILLFFLMSHSSALKMTDIN